VQPAHSICSVTCHTALLDAWKRRSVGARRVHHRQRPRPGWRAPAAAPRTLRPNGASAWQNVLCVFLATFTQHACAASTQHACAARSQAARSDAYGARANAARQGDKASAARQAELTGGLQGAPMPSMPMHTRLQMAARHLRGTRALAGPCATVLALDAATCRCLTCQRRAAPRSASTAAAGVGAPDVRAGEHGQERRPNAAIAGSRAQRRRSSLPRRFPARASARPPGCSRVALRTRLPGACRWPASVRSQQISLRLPGAHAAGPHTLPRTRTVPELLWASERCWRPTPACPGGPGCER
jgi:hypothetical protein